MFHQSALPGPGTADAVLFSEAGAEDAPTRIRVGSHPEAPKVLEEYGEEGATGPVLAPGLEAAPARRPPDRKSVV